MKINGKHEVLAQIARRGLLLAALLAMALSVATITRAQSAAASSPTQDAKFAPAAATTVQAPAVVLKPAAVAAKGTASPAEKSAAKGPHEGITIHGHWTIEVKNPDGTIASRQDFENAIDPIEGADALTGLLSGEYVTEGFLIDLYAPTGLLCNNGFAGSPAPDCLLLDTRNPLLCPSTSIAVAACGSLTYTPNSGTANSNGVGYTLSGSVQIPKGNGGTITTVSHGVLACIPGANNSLGSALGTTRATFVTNATSATAFSTSLVGLAGGRTTCSSTNDSLESLAITSKSVSQVVSELQTVYVTVVITFS
jgi:hypothetical protein